MPGFLHHCCFLYILSYNHSGNCIKNTHVYEQLIYLPNSALDGLRSTKHCMITSKIQTLCAQINLDENFKELICTCPNFDD